MTRLGQTNHTTLERHYHMPRMHLYFSVGACVGAEIELRPETTQSPPSSPTPPLAPRRAVVEVSVVPRGRRALGGCSGLGWPASGYSSSPHLPLLTLPGWWRSSTAHHPVLPMAPTHHTELTNLSKDTYTNSFHSYQEAMEKLYFSVGGGVGVEVGVNSDLKHAEKTPPHPAR